MATELAKRDGKSASQLAGKYLTFGIQGESYGIDVLQVREIIRLIGVTVVPQMPAYVRGVINLRGKIIPVMDLRLRFGFSEITDTELTCIVVVQVQLPDGKVTPMGLVVDGVEEVINIAAGDIEETPDFGVTIATEYILGMAKIKDTVKTLLAVDRIIAAESLLQSIQRAALAAPAPAATSPQQLQK